MTAAYGTKIVNMLHRGLSVGGGNWIPGAGSIARTQNAGSYSAPQFNAQGLFNSQGVYEANSGSTQLVSVPVGWGHATYEAYGQNSFLGKYAALGHVQPNNRAGVHLETTQGPSGFLGTTSNVILSGMSGSMAIATLVLEYQGNTGTASGPIDPSISRPDPLSGYERYEIPDWDGYGADAIKPDTLRPTVVFWHFFRGPSAIRTLRLALMAPLDWNGHSKTVRCASCSSISAQAIYGTATGGARQARQKLYNHKPLAQTQGFN